MDEKKIALYMKNLDLTREEAIELIKDEEENNLPELTEEQAKVAKDMLKGSRKKETAPRKRERKVDEDRRFLMDAFVWALTTDIEQDGDNVNADDVAITIPEREIEFSYKGVRYRLTLAKPRK